LTRQVVLAYVRKRWPFAALGTLVIVGGVMAMRMA
jgi:hypothetical protein